MNRKHDMRKRAIKMPFIFFFLVQFYSKFADAQTYLFNTTFEYQKMGGKKKEDPYVFI